MMQKKTATVIDIVFLTLGICWAVLVAYSMIVVGPEKAREREAAQKQRHDIMEDLLRLQVDAGVPEGKRIDMADWPE